MTTQTPPDEPAVLAAPKVTAPPYTAPLSQIWGWAAGRVSEFGLIATYGQAMTIFTIGFGLDPRIVGWCMMLPRLVDGVIDPAMGHWSDNTHTRWGRRKPFLLGGALLGSIFLAALWWASPAWSATAQFAYLFAIGMCLYICYGAYAMSWNAIGYELSDDYHERAKVAAIGGFVLAIMGFLNSWIYWLALRPAFGDVIWGMRWIGGAVAILVVIFALITVWSTQERFTHANPSKHHVALLPAIRTTLRNRAFVVLLLMKVCEILGGRLTAGISFYLGVYYVCRGDQDLASRLAAIGGTLGGIWNIAMLPLVKPASKFVGKRGALIVSALIGFITAIIAPFITTPEHPYWTLIPGLIVAPLLVITATIAGAILPDICDVDELETGERREGLYTSVMGFVNKLEISLAVALVGYVVSWADVDTNIANRWSALISDKPALVSNFRAGESATFELSGVQPVVFDKLTFRPAAAANCLREIECWVGNDTPTAGFHLASKFHPTQASAGALFKPVSARFLRIVTIKDDSAPDDTFAIEELRLSNSANLAQNNILSSRSGAKVLAVQPPHFVLSRLYWLVMIPGVIFAGMTFLMTVFFPLTEKQMLSIRQALDYRRLQKAVEGEPTDEVAEQFIHTHPAAAKELLRERD